MTTKYIFSTLFPDAPLKRRVHLIASKIFRGAGVDFEDCLMLVKSHKDKINIERLEKHVKELAGYDTSEERIIDNLNRFLKLLQEENIYG